MMHANPTVSLSCLHIGHTHLTQGHLMASEVFPVRLSIFHVLVECFTYYVPCNRFFPFLDISASLQASIFSPNFSSDIFYYISASP